MNLPFPVKPATELLDAEFAAKWKDRQVIDPTARAVLQSILQQFVEVGGPVDVHAITAAMPGCTPDRVRRAVAALDDKDLVVLDNEHVTLAYPFASGPTAFQVILPDGRQRYAVCAIDALGIPAMLRCPVTARSRCHSCGAPIEIEVGPNGPRRPSDVVVWVGPRGDRGQRACSSICLTLNFFCSLDHLRRWWEASLASGRAGRGDGARRPRVR